MEAVFRVVAVWPAMKGANRPRMSIIEANRGAILTKFGGRRDLHKVGGWRDAQSHTLKSCRARLRDKLVHTWQGSGCKPLQNNLARFF